MKGNQWEYGAISGLDQSVMGKNGKRENKGKKGRKREKRGENRGNERDIGEKRVDECMSV